MPDFISKATEALKASQDKAGIGGAVGLLRDPSTLDQRQTQQVPTGLSIIDRLDSARHELRELKARLRHIGNMVSGVAPADPTEAKDPESIAEMIEQLNEIILGCHNELTRTTKVLGL